MKHPSLSRATLAILAASTFHAGAALENRAESLGPLKRYDPNGPTSEFIAKIHGDPRKGLPETAGHRVQRVSDTTWYLELGKRIARMEPNYPTGQVVLREVLDAGGEWAISPDGKQIFATRTQQNGSEVSECFDLETGEPKWALEKKTNVMDVCFTPDGKQVVILHSLPRPPATERPVMPPNPTEEDVRNFMKSVQPSQAALSWYDTASGEMTRRINLPGQGSSRGLITDYLSYSRNFLYVARPCDDAPAECLFIKDDATEPVKIDAGAAGQDEEPVVLVGGKFGEFVVFHSERNAVLFRRDKEGALTRITEVELEGTSDGNSYRWGARFTPDGNHLVLSSCAQTIFVPTRDPDGVQRKVFPGGSHLADFSVDGKFLATFDDGGGRVRSSSTWEMMESFQSRIRPPHCCPITEAGFSITGNYIISSDNVRLLLWSREGVQLAELYSARSDAKEAVRMQSPVVVEEQDKVYAADGYDFLVWDLKALKQRLSRKPDNIPRVKGEVVFNDRTRRNTSPELMNILMDPKGEHIVTATRSVVRYRPVANAEPVNVPVPEDDIFMRPRMFMEGVTPGTVIVRPGMDAYSLDLTGKNKSSRLVHHFIGTYAAADQKFVVTTSGGSQSILLSRPVQSLQDASVQATEVVKLPPGWYLRPEFAVLSPDGKWVVAIPTVWGKGSVVAVIDVAKHEVVNSVPVDWTATSVSTSRDGKRFLVGSTNRAVYEFDLLKMAGQQ